VGATDSKEKSEQRHVLCKHGEIEPGEMRGVKAGRRSLALVRLEDGSYRAIIDTCPHEGATLSKGKLEKMWVSEEVGRYESSEEQAVVVCPWHNFEYDVDTGQAYAPKNLRVKAYEVEVEGEDVVVYL
jgi:3-phenylpropionate/trans-cinnamate dioxygenase ferredoxin subunit